MQGFFLVIKEDSTTVHPVIMTHKLVHHNSPAPGHEVKWPSRDSIKYSVSQPRLRKNYVIKFTVQKKVRVQWPETATPETDQKRQNQFSLTPRLIPLLIEQSLIIKKTKSLYVNGAAPRMFTHIVPS